MRSRRFLLARTLPAMVSLALLAGCGHKGLVSAHANLRPTIELTRAPYNQSTRFEYSYRMDWLGYDPDGRIDHYVYAIDPPSPTTSVPEPETLWTRTMRSEELINFTASQPDSSNPAVHGASDFHTFVVKAIDNGGLQSAPLFRSFFTYTVAPTVTILSPSPSDRNVYYTPPSVRVTWSGTDDDGIFDSKKPIQYKFLLLKDDPRSLLPISYQIAVTDPDSVRRYYAPRNWAGWDSTSGDTTFAQLSGLTPTIKYCFIVVAFDEAGAYSPVFSLNGNMLNLSITYAAQGGPLLTIYNEIFFYPYRTSQFSTDPQYWIELEVGADQPITFHWFGSVATGIEITGYSWSLDNDDVTDDTARRPDEEQTDLKHWSAASESNTQATVGPFSGNNEEHLFYVKANDSIGLRSLGVVHMRVVRSTLAKPLAIVNDTRLTLLNNAPGSQCPGAPTGRWPAQAEEDTFLFARGGFPWTCYPAGTTSSPGLFAGYSFDTLNTRLGRFDLHVPLAFLGQYSHVIWITDASSAIKNGLGTDLRDGLCALRYMTSGGRSNSLAAYIQQGGNVWLAGGGIAMATSVSYNKTSNDPGGGYGAGFTFASDPANLAELIPGRMMYDLPHWQSEFKVSAGSNDLIVRDLGRFDSNAVGKPPMYDRLPPVMRLKSPATDPLPPQRTNPSSFYVSSPVPVEYLSQPNYIQEDANPDPAVEDLESALDTLYSASANQLVQNAHNVCMTVYRGHDTIRPVIFSGFSLWQFARADCKQLVDAVLQGEWNLPYVPPSASSLAGSVSHAQPSASAAAPPAWSPPTVSRGGPATRATVQGGR